jgi:sugar phosphate isomerase/epimerase
MFGSDQQRAVSATVGAGLKHVEVRLDALGSVDVDADVSAARAIRDCYGAAGLRVACVRVLGPLVTETLQHADEDVFAAVGALGADTCVLSLSVHRDAAARRERQLDVIRRLGDLAVASGMRLAVELFETGPTGTRHADARAMCRLAADVEHENVGVGFDAGRFIREHHTSSIDIALQRVLPWLFALRLSDHSGTPGDDELLPLGDGVVLDGCRVREILTTQRYSGPVVVHAHDASSAEESLRSSVAYLRRCGWRIVR